MERRWIIRDPVGEIDNTSAYDKDALSIRWIDITRDTK
jgi:hypothetical protein